MRRRSASAISPATNGAITSMGDLGIGPAGEAGDRLGRELRPRLRHIEPAVLGEAGQENIGETERGR